MRVIVVGGGIAGVATAYWLYRQGIQVSLVERHATVAQEATLGHSGLVLPGPLDAGVHPGSLPGISGAHRGGLLSTLFRSSIHADQHDLAMRTAGQQLAHFALQYLRLKPLIAFAKSTLDEMQSHHAIAYEKQSGALHLFRKPEALQCAKEALLLLTQQRYPHRLLTMDDCLTLEPALSHESFAGGILMPDVQSANCPLFAKQLKRILVEGGVQLFLEHEAINIQIEETGVHVACLPRKAESVSAIAPCTETLVADAVVLASGAGSQALLERAGVQLPLHLVRCSALTAPIADEEAAPQSALIDTIEQTTLMRAGRRMRFASAPAIFKKLCKTEQQRKCQEAIFDKMKQTALGWVPGAVRLSAAHHQDHIRLLSQDGLPIVGCCRDRLFVNMAHGSAGWALACGSARFLAQLISDHKPALDDDMSAMLSPGRFT